LSVSAGQSEDCSGDGFEREKRQLKQFNRVQMMKDAEGRTIHPLISAGKTVVPPGCANPADVGLAAPNTCGSDREKMEKNCPEPRARIGCHFTVTVITVVRPDSTPRIGFPEYDFDRRQHNNLQ
jgi:hypothetical protein